jgi:DNA-binding MarR family transcriptional regulator
MEKVLHMADVSSARPSTSPQEGSHLRVEALLAEVNALSIRLNSIGRGHGSQGGLPTAAYAVLQMLQRQGPHTVPQIARRRSTSRQNIQSLVNRLESQGCVELTRNPAHRRSALVNLTGRGRTLLLQEAEAYKLMLDNLAGDIPELELADATRLLNAIRQLLSEAKAPNGPVSCKRNTSTRRSSRPKSEQREEENPTVPGPVLVKPGTEGIPSGEEDFPVNLL